MTDFIEQFLQPCCHSPHSCILLPISTGINRVLFTDQILHYCFFWQIMSGCIQQNSSPAKSRLICNLRIVYQPLQTQHTSMQNHNSMFNTLQVDKSQPFTLILLIHLLIAKETKTLILKMIPRPP